jgi:ATP-dependent phosphofructokinase / diphosphate-dependent phosphofructokinase
MANDKPVVNPASDGSQGKVVLRGNAVIAQSGGPTDVINASLVGAIKELVRSQEIKGIFGSRHGIKGILSEDFIDLRAESPRTLDRIAKTPSAALGSVRMKPTTEDCQHIFDVCQKHDVRYFFYIGGNDSAETAHIVAEAAANANFDMRVYHIPKTIDNDLCVTDHCPGYGSAARFVALALMGDQLDNRALPGVKIDVVMGRHAGFLTAASVLGQQRGDDGPHLVYVPERPFSLDKFAADVKRVHDELGRCLVAVSEGVEDEQGRPILESGERDSHGNLQLSGTGALGDFLVQTVKERVGKDLRVRADTFGYLQRCFPEVVSKVDFDEAMQVGREAARAATLDERPNGSVIIRRGGTAKTYLVSYGLTDLENVAQKTKKLPDEFINAEGNGVTEAFRDYATPLVGRLPRFGWFKNKPIA